MIKVLKNQTASIIVIKDVGIEVPASGQYTIQAMDFLLWVESADIDAHINSGDIIVNNGARDLPAATGLAFLHDLTIAEDVEFDNSTNGFTANKVQDAIVEAKNAAASGLPDFILVKDGALVLTRNGGFVLRKG